MADSIYTQYQDKTKVESNMYTAANKNKSNSSISVDDFLYLLAAQLSNQDMMNPMNDTEFIGQLAQFTNLEVMQQMMQLNSTSYSASLLGQEVTVARVLSNGDMQIVTGTVTGVGLYYDEPVVYVNGDTTPYTLSEIMVVGTMPEEKKTDGDGDGEGNTGGENGTGGTEGTGGEGDD